MALSLGRIYISGPPRTLGGGGGGGRFFE